MTDQKDVALSLEELELAMQDWTPKAKARAMEAFKERTSGQRRVWYCASPGPACDGRPHEGYPYPHARGDQWPPTGQMFAVRSALGERMPGLFTREEAERIAQEANGTIRRRKWFVFAMRGGRGSGKTRAGAEYTRVMTRHTSRIALIAPTNGDVRDTMIEGESGLEAVFLSAGERIHYEPSKRRVTFPNGCRAGIFSGEEPDRLRGPQHGFGWLDEPAHIPAIDSVWSNFLFGLRLGKDPKVAVTTTPTPKPWMKDLVKDPRTVSRVVSTYANLENLADTYKRNVISKYEGTRLGQQELMGEILDDVEGALWKQEIIRYATLARIGDSLPDASKFSITPEMCDRIVVAIDPAGVVNKKSDETGIIVVGRYQGICYVFADRTGKYSPNNWAGQALDAFEAYKADAIVAEKNYGGEMVETVIQNVAKERGLMPRIIIVTATRGKEVRAEPIVGLYEQGKVLHVRTADVQGGRAALAKLEGEMLGWVPGTGPSPNRVDALVWAITDLMQLNNEIRIATPKGRTLARPDAYRGAPRLPSGRSGLLIPQFRSPFQ